MKRPNIVDFVRGGLPDYWKYSTAMSKYADYLELELTIGRKEETSAHILLDETTIEEFFEQLTIEEQLELMTNSAELMNRDKSQILKKAMLTLVTDDMLSDTNYTLLKKGSVTMEDYEKTTVRGPEAYKGALDDMHPGDISEDTSESNAIDTIQLLLDKKMEQVDWPSSEIQTYAQGLSDMYNYLQKDKSFIHH